MENKANITTEYIVKLLQFPRIGRKTARKLIYNLNFRITCDNDLFDYIDENRIKFNLPEYNASTLNDIIDKANSIIASSEKSNIKLLSFLDSNYPTKLLSTDDFPLLINYKGNINSLIIKPSVAVIGTRKPTSFGNKLGKRIGEVLALNNINVVSGLAIGCDTAGHLGAIEAHGTTTCVLAHGLDSIYPKENANLADRILHNDGLLISEYFIKQRPVGNFFVERDRIQAGVSDCVFVVETGIKGGTMHTVRFCQSYKRILACLNHPLKFHNEAQIQGNQLIIREMNAIPIYTKSDIDHLISKVTDRFNAKSCPEKIDNQEPDNSLTNYHNKAKQLNLWR
ncbi:DNA-processing protein DprA [Desulfurivibrio sp. C05AmB]|uniref:DNA-processing protein DprA n=1 Tax=Desulfurivibrio sp. C05AmB TaxID=3374371 RepID=UPI00376EAD3C